MSRPSRTRIARVTALYGCGNDDSTPELALLNLVDLMLVFAVGLMVALVSYYGLQEVMMADEAVITVKKPGESQVDVIIKKPDKIERMQFTEDTLQGEGVRIGTAYRLNSGEVVYVPETTDTSVGDKDTAAVNSD